MSSSSGEHERKEEGKKRPLALAAVTLGVTVALGVLVLVFSAIAVVTVLSESRLADKDQYISNAEAEQMVADAEEWADAWETRFERHRTLVLFFDGLRYEGLRDVPALGTALTEGPAAADGKLYRLQAALPTISFPNYVTLNTGAPPELTGFFGNKNSDGKKTSVQTGLDTWQRGCNRTYAGEVTWDALAPRTDEAAQYWFASIADIGERRQLNDSGCEDSTVEQPGSHGVIVRRPASEWACELTSGDADVTYFIYDEIDAEGHTGRLSRPEYKRELQFAADLIDEVIERIDDSTVLVVMSDHGHIDEGGHGGMEKHLRDVPFLLYRKDSGIGASTTPVPQLRDDPLLGGNKDVPATLAMLSGTRLPRQSQGVALDFATAFAGSTEDEIRLQYADMLLQQDAFLRKFFTATRNDRDGTTDALLDEIQAHLDAGSPYALETTVSLLRRALDDYQRVRDNEERMQRNRATALAVITWAFVTLALFFMAGQTTLRYSGHSGLAFVLGFFYVAAYLVCQVGFFYLFFEWTAPVDDEWIWNSSQLDTANKGPYVAYMAFIGVPVLVYINYARHFAIGGVPFAHYLLGVHSGADPADFSPRDKWVMLQRTKMVIMTYELVWAVSAGLLTLAFTLASNAFHDSFDIPWTSIDGWSEQFQAMHMLIMIAALLIYVLYKNIVFFARLSHATLVMSGAIRAPKKGAVAEMVSEAAKSK